MDEHREKVERLITTLEDAATVGCELPVRFSIGGGISGGVPQLGQGYDVYMGIPMGYWEAVIESLNALVEDLDAQRTT
jgi:hypothetical protein